MSNGINSLIYQLRKVHQESRTFAIEQPARYWFAV